MGAAFESWTTDWGGAMELDTRQLAAFIGKLTLGVRNVLQVTQPDHFEIGRGSPVPGEYPYVLRLADPMDTTTAALVAEELNRAFWFEGHHVHRPSARAGEGPQIVYMAWSGKPYPGSALPHSR